MMLATKCRILQSKRQPNKRLTDAYRVLISAAFVLIANTSALASDTDTDALFLADTTPNAVEYASNMRSFVEGAYGGDTLSNRNTEQQNYRLSFDLQYENAFAFGWRAIFANRLDINWPPQSNFQNSIDTIKEAYVSRQAQSDAIIDMGRINIHDGVAMGYNPTDYFRLGAVRSVVSSDPSSLKANRQGSVMLRDQALWDSGSFTVLYSPKISDQASNDSFNPNWGATNSQDRFLISIGQKISDSIKPQFLIYKETDLPVQLGFNLTGLINDAMVVYVEWSGGLSPSLLTQALTQQGVAPTDDTTFRNNVSTGITYTTTNNISLTAELEYNDRGMDKTNWDALYGNSPAMYGLYRNWLQVAQESPTKKSIFLYGKWQDALINHLDFSIMERFDAVDYSRLTWLETRYHFGSSEFALQWQSNSGQSLSNYGAAPQIQSWQVLFRLYI